MEERSKPRGNPQISCRVPPEWIQEMERRSEGRPMAAVMREALAVYLNKNVPGSEIEKKYLVLEERLSCLESKMREQ